MNAMLSQLMLFFLQQEEEETVGLAETLESYWFYIGFLFLVLLWMYVYWRWWRDWGRFLRPGKIGTPDDSMGAVDLHQTRTAPDCNDGLPYFAVIDEARQCAEQGALQVAAKCATLGADCHPSEPWQQYVEWGCRRNVPVTITLPDGQQVQVRASMKYAIVMYAVSCSREF